MDITQQAQADTNGCSHKHSAGGQLHHRQLYVLPSPFSVRGQAQQMMCCLPGTSERVVTETRERVNQHNEYDGVCSLIFLCLPFFSLPPPSALQVCPLQKLPWTGSLPFPSLPRSKHSVCGESGWLTSFLDMFSFVIWGLVVCIKRKDIFYILS